MTESPILDDRDEAAIFEALVERADVYTEEWNPHTPDTGRTLLRIFATFEADVRKQLNSVPEKHLLGFLDALDFERQPPQAARAPLTFHVSADLDRNVVVPGGTQAIAGAGDDAQLYELPQNGGFEATGATLSDVIAVDPSADAIVDHSGVLADDETTELFTGENMQEHHLYVGNADALNLAPGSTLSLAVETTIDSETFSAATTWEYYGEDPGGTEGWHELEPPGDDDQVEGSGIEAYRQELKNRAVDATGAAPGGSADGRNRQTPVEETFRVPGEITEAEVNGVESRWLRCRFTGTTRDVFSGSVRAPTVDVGSADRDSGLDPDVLLSNDVPLSPTEGDIRPLGELPQPPTAFYVACEEAFTKPGGAVTLTFAPPSDDDAQAETAAEGTAEAGSGPERSAETSVIGGAPRLSWEYWNGDGWTRLDAVEDGTDTFSEPGTVEFRVPADIERTTVSGHENVWVRARLVSGNYGRPSIELPTHDEFDGSGSEPDPPTFGDVTVEYDHSEQQFESIFRYNNASYSEDLTERGDSFVAFEELTEAEQTLYLGFDGTLRDGPLTLFVPVEDATYPEWFDPGMEWEYCTGQETEPWRELDVRDRTGGLTEHGIVTLTVPGETGERELFDRSRHWIRIRATGDEFDSRDQSMAASDRAGARRSTAESGRGGVGQSTAESGRAGADSRVADRSSRTTAPPVLEGIYPNTQWAYNKRTVEDEILGSSDGSHDQEYACAHAPVIDIDVWVDELSTLSASERRRLVEERPGDVERVTDERGDVTEFWVRWQTVADFLDSGPTDRHYVATRTLGTVEFGDGDNGAIPPSGTDNVRATYTTGGGSDGNVDAGTITDLKSSISLVDDVTNPRAGDGGTDVESVDSLVRRSTSRIRHRGRAVTASDYEQVARSEFRVLSAVKCEKRRDEDGTRVTVVIVPETERAKPLPSMELKHRVRDVLCERAPATVVEADGMDVVVRGPGYADLSVEATVRASNVKSVSLLKGQIREQLDAYLHPLTGQGGEGWSFGELPDVAALERLIDGVETVSEVVELDAYVETNGERQPLTGRTVDVVVPADTLVCSGDHELSVTMEAF